MSKADRDNVLELLMDVSGTTKHVGDAINLLDKLNFFGKKTQFFEKSVILVVFRMFKNPILSPESGSRKHFQGCFIVTHKIVGMEGEIFSVTEKISTAYDLLEKSFNVLQHSQIKQKGYTFLEKHQMMRLYRDQGRLV
jgi:hypothetical protein